MRWCVTAPPAAVGAVLLVVEDEPVVDVELGQRDGDVVLVHHLRREEVHGRLARHHLDVGDADRRVRVYQLACENPNISKLQAAKVGRLLQRAEDAPGLRTCAGVRKISVVKPGPRRLAGTAAPALVAAAHKSAARVSACGAMLRLRCLWLSFLLSFFVVGCWGKREPPGGFVEW